MKRSVITVILILVALLPLDVAAQEDDEPGIFGNIILGGGWKGGRASNLEVTDDNKRIDSLDDRGDYKNEATPVVFGTVGYRFAATQTEIAANLQAAFQGGVDLSLAQPLEGVGTFTLAATWMYEKVWQDPYLVGADRSKTTNRKAGVGFAWEEILGSGAQIGYHYENHDVKDDVSGEQNEDLRRDGIEHTLELGYSLPISPNSVITPTVNLHKGDFEGDSNSYNGFGFGLEHFLGLGRWIFNTSAGLTWYDFKEKHAVFDEKREEISIGASEFITYVEPFGWRGFSAHALISYELLDSNIAFFEQTDMIVGLGIGYNF